MGTPAIKETLHQLADQLNDDATWDDVMEKVRFRQAIEKGIRAADRGDFATQDEVKTAFTRWGVNVRDWVDSACLSRSY